METHLTRVIANFAGMRLAVIGDVMLDSYLEGQAGRLCREAPVPVVTLDRRTDAPGGAANTAANLRSMGAEVRLLSVLGDDGEGHMLRRMLEQRGVAAEDLIIHPDRTTLAKHRICAAGHMLVRLDQGSTGALDERTEQLVLDRLTDLFLGSDALIVSDYGYGILTKRVIAALADLQAQVPRILVVDAKYLHAYRHMGITAVKPNYGEVQGLLGDVLDGSGARIERIAAQGEQLLNLLGAQIVAVTLDTDGALIFERGSPPYRTYARPTPHSRATGAGDTFVSTLTLALAAGADTPTAAELASASAAIVVGRSGTVSCSADELRAYVAAESKATDLERLVTRLESYRQQGRRIVFTNGCFDILHRGHITYLNRAKALGDILIVGVNTDESIKRLKGPQRPINTLEDRVQVLAALSCIDHVVPFGEDTPHGLISAIRPDVFVKGGDYTRERLPEAALVEALGGMVEILPFLENHSTTSLIERIREVNGDLAAIRMWG